MDHQNPQPRGSVAPPGWSGASPVARPYPPQAAPPHGGPIPTQVQPPAPPAPQPPAASSYGAVLTRTMLLVGGFLIAFLIGSLANGAGDPATSRYFWYAGAAMFLAPCWVGDLRRGTVGIGWSACAALALGLGFGPVLASFLMVNPDVVAEAAATTVVVVFGAALYGSLTARDLVAWMRPVSIALFGAVALSWIVVCGGGATASVVSMAIGALSAVAIVLDFNHLRRHAVDDDAVWLATGIFVSIINLFLSLLGLLRN